MPAFIDLTGQRFGRWLVLGRTPNDKSNNTMWYCLCDCGRRQIVQGGRLRNGGSRKCIYCNNKANPTKHGLSETRLYFVWVNMIRRCEHSNGKYYKNYGGRGIKVCSEWHDAATFFKWALANGYKEGLTIDRVDNDGDYEPSNCQFLTRSENTLKAWHIDGSYRERHLTVS